MYSVITCNDRFDSIYEKQIELISEILLEHKVAAVIISNTTANNRANLQDITKYQKGGLSGKPLEDISNVLVSKFYKLLKKKFHLLLLKVLVLIL